MMTFYAIAAFLFSLAYLLIMLRYWINWARLPQWEIPENFEAKTSVSIIVPARNEAKHIGSLLNALLQQNYPKNLIEIIVVDDHSEDETASIVKSFKNNSILLLSLKQFLTETTTNSFKKKAIDIAIQHAKGKLIVTTDADCEMGKDWLNYLVSYYEHTGAKFLAAPVNFFKEKTLIEEFQSLDYIGMMAITGAGIYGQFGNLCNGANLAYEKEAFHAVDGFAGIDQLASGDDMLLMQKIADKFPGQIAFVKHKAARVFSYAKENWQSFIQQRIRWASKSSAYTAWEVQLILVLVFLYCCSILFGFLLIPLIPGIWKLVLGQLLMKIIIDYFFLKNMATYFERKDLMLKFIPAQFLHLLYIVSIGFLANLVKNYQWKGRKTK